MLRAWHGVLAARLELLVATTVAEVAAPVAVTSEAHVDMGLAVLEAYLDEGPGRESRQPRARLPAGC